ncbi:MAG: LemA family protein [Ignavibacteriaceae bacterium]|nr:LemA family protein [Ignavibacteriaceae bacterium]
MKKWFIIGGIVFVVLLVMGIFWGISSYNSFVALNEEVNNAWGQVENQYQRRADLIPNLVNTVKGYADFEKEVLTNVTEARAKVSQLTVTKDVLDDPQSFARFQQAQSELGGAISRLLVTVENYPDLKANESFQQLQAQLEGTENRITVARNKYNDVVKLYNTAVKRFPVVLIAGLLGFRDKQYFQSAPGSENAPKVEF